MSAAAICPGCPPYLPALRSKSRRIPAVSATPIGPILRNRRLHFSPCNSCTLRHCIRNSRESSVEGYDAAGIIAPAARSAIFSCRELFEFRGGFFRRRWVTAGAGARVVSSDSGFFHYNWAKEEAAEGAGRAKEFLMVTVENLKARKQRISQWAPWVVIISTVTLAAIFASRFQGRVFAATIVAASFFGLFVEDERLQLIGGGFESALGKVGSQMHILREAIPNVAHEFERFLGSLFSSIIPTLAVRFEWENLENWSGGRTSSMSEAGLVPLAPSSVTRTENLDVDLKPNLETLVRNMSESIAQLSSIVGTAGLSAAHPALLGEIKSGIQDLCRELHSVEGAVPARQSEFDSKVSQGMIHSVESQLIPGSNSQLKQISDQLLTTKCIVVEEATNVPPFDQSVTSPSTHLEGIETLEVPPPPSGTWSIAAIATDEPKVEESLRFEVVEIIPKSTSTSESVGGLGESSPNVISSHPVEFHEDSHTTKSPGEGQSSNYLMSSMQTPLMGPQRRRNRSPDPWHNNCMPLQTEVDELARANRASSGDVSSCKHTQVIEFQRRRSRSPDPWQNDCTTRPVEQDRLTRSIWAVNSSDSSNEEGRHLVDLFLIDNEHSKAETASNDGAGTGRGVNTYSRLDFWGKNAGRINKTSEQRGTLTKIKATARESNFGSTDDLDEDWPQEQRRRTSSEEEQQQLLRRDFPSTSNSGRAAQPWDETYQPGASGREAVSYDQRIYRDADSSPPADDYRRVEADTRGPQVVRADGDLEGTRNIPLVRVERRNDEGMPQSRDRTDARGDRDYSAAVERRASSTGRTGSTKISSSPSTSRKGEGRWSTQSTDDARVANDGNFSGSKRVRNLVSNQDTVMSSGQESGQKMGKGSPNSIAYTLSQPETIESSFALEQPKQTQSIKFQNYLEEAEALLEQGMQGLEGRIEVGVAERMLYEATDLLGKACDIYPSSLIAVGQLGNTLLVHGELKLKLSQQLRSMLPSPQANFPAIGGRQQESMEITLQEVCEECEELLVDAGRKFRTALSLDKSDVRALYNWGLALCYRGQLIAEEGGERALLDADKVYLAAIDKFEAMLGISQDYVSIALFNWGVAMRDRARLRGMGDKDRPQLLLQAKELFQDALRLDPSNGQARGAVAVCSAELKELQSFAALRREDTRENPVQNWWQRRS